MDYGDWRLGPPQLAEALQVQSASQHPLAPTSADLAKALQGQYWKRTWPGAETVNVNVVDKWPYGEGVNGYTICDKNKRLCDIMIRGGADLEAVEKHERMHTSGVDHPDYPRHLSPESTLNIMNRR